jgi:hypothetical protein
MQQSDVLLYRWRHGRAILETWLIGRPGTVRVQRLLRLVRVQDATATRVLGSATTQGQGSGGGCGNPFG